MSSRRRHVLVASLVSIIACALCGCSSCNRDRAAGDRDAFVFKEQDDTSEYRPGWTTETVAAYRRPKVDALLVLDNTETMCRKQTAIAESMRGLVDRFQRSRVDFHLAVTTTHNVYAANPPPDTNATRDRHLFGPDAEPAREDTPLEPVAEAGQIQSLPNPTISSDERCQFRLNSGDADGPDRTDVEPVRELLDRAVRCTRAPEDYRTFDPDNDFEELAKCALTDDPESSGASDAHEYCEEVGKRDSFGKRELMGEIFPCGQKLGRRCRTEADLRKVYRPIPKVVRRRDYAGEDGILSETETQKLLRDLRCMTLVGTSGHEFEQGLRNTALAVHPLMTGGPAGDPFRNRTFTHPVTGEDVTVEEGENRPNHGFLRADATTVVEFVSDENDCSHRGHTILERDRQHGCGELHCYFPTKEGSEFEGDLLATSTLFDAFVENLATSRRRDDLRVDELLLSSIHGTPAPYGAPTHPQADTHRIPERCTGETVEELEESLGVCSNSLGTSRSGDRYAAFLKEAQQAGYEQVGSSGPQGGRMCNRPSVLGSRTALPPGNRSPVCLDSRVLQCQEESDCPPFRGSANSGEAERCRRWGAADGDSGRYCASALRLLMRPTEGRSPGELDRRNRERLRHFCVEGTLGEAMPNGCLVRRTLYSWTPCRTNPHSMQLQWNSGVDQATPRGLSAFEVLATYREASAAPSDAR